MTNTSKTKVQTEIVSLLPGNIIMFMNVDTNRTLQEKSPISCGSKLWMADDDLSRNNAGFLHRNYIYMPRGKISSVHLLNAVNVKAISSLPMSQIHHYILQFRSRNI